MSNPYDYTDRIITVLNRKFIKRFNQAGSDLLFMDELNVLRYCEDMYDELLNITRRYFLRLAKQTYKTYHKAHRVRVDMKWIDKILNEPDDIVMYIFVTETDRKASRFAESMIASGEKRSQVKVGLRYWSKMVEQFADTITYDAMTKAFKDGGAKKVMWLAEHDNRTCGECWRLDREIFDIDKIPPRPHWGCRCWLKPIYK